MSQNPAIVVIGFDRPNSIRRLLEYLKLAKYPSRDIQLVISLDFADSDGGKQTQQIAETFEWPHGPKRIIQQTETLGLREHVLRCGDLSREYESIVVFEDDISVSLDFYRFATAALDFCADDDQVGGVALYSRRTNQVAMLPFNPIYDGADNFYLQIAASWGQAWHVSQWNKFRDWYDRLPERPNNPHEQIPKSAPIPRKFINFPKSSWLKYFIWYLSETDRYFFHPRVSYSTNHSDKGVHSSANSNRWQVPLAVRATTNTFRFATVQESLAVYDSFFELEPNRLKEINPLLAEHDFDVDLYGTKSRALLKRPLVLTSRKTDSDSAINFPLERKPFESNFGVALQPQQKAFFSLVAKEKTTDETTLEFTSLEVLRYFYDVIPVWQIVKNIPGYSLQKRNKRGGLLRMILLVPAKFCEIIAWNIRVRLGGRK